MENPALTPKQQEAFDKKKVQVRLENEKYLRDHPELKDLTMKFLQKVLVDRPGEIESYAARFFTDETSYKSSKGSKKKKKT